ncbi:unnamed protein product, partial [Owenia fusiformis]
KNNMASVENWNFNEIFSSILQIPSYHLLFEGLLIVVIIRLFFTQSYKPEHNLSDKEKKELVEEWTPEPLVPDTPSDHPALLALVHDNVVSGPIGKLLNINGQPCINLATFNFLGLAGNCSIKEEAVRSLRKYGVGSCGPRGFYGTVDVHLELEEKLAKYMQCEEAILYSYGFATVASAIPAYSKRGDVIFCDDGVSFAIQKGIQASRSKVVYFKHNDMQDLERVLKEQDIEDKKNPKKAKVTRRFMIVEGLYLNHGDICPLPQLIDLKWKYKVRIFIDESISFGTLGKSGKGVTEHFNIPVSEIDLITASIENSVGSIGGFCCGKAYVVDHQRLSGLGYCFSASLPPMLASAAIQSLNIMREKPQIFQSLQQNAQYMHNQLQRLPGLTVCGLPVSPIQHLRLIKPTGDRSRDQKTLQKIVDLARDKGVALTVARYLDTEEQHLPPVSIRVTVNIELKEEDMKKSVDVLETIVRTVLQ